MLRLVLLLVLFILIARTFWRVVDNVIVAASGRPPDERGAPPLRGAKMVRDPICGTFVLPERAVSIAGGRGRVYFCSDACRDRYRAEGHASPRGRTA